MAMRAPIDLAAVRERKADRRSEAEELRIEVRAAGQEMQAMSFRIRSALAVEDIHTAMHYANRLGHLGGQYANTDNGGDAA